MIKKETFCYFRKTKRCKTNLYDFSQLVKSRLPYKNKLSKGTGLTDRLQQEIDKKNQLKEL